MAKGKTREKIFLAWENDPDRTPDTMIQYDNKLDAALKIEDPIEREDAFGLAVWEYKKAAWLEGFEYATRIWADK